MKQNVWSWPQNPIKCVRKKPWEGSTTLIYSPDGTKGPNLIRTHLPNGCGVIYSGVKHSTCSRDGPGSCVSFVNEFHPPLIRFNSFWSLLLLLEALYPTRARRGPHTISCPLFHTQHQAWVCVVDFVNHLFLFMHVLSRLPALCCIPCFSRSTSRVGNISGVWGAGERAPHWKHGWWEECVVLVGRSQWIFPCHDF